MRTGNGRLQNDHDWRGSIGWQVGVQATDLVLVFRSLQPGPYCTGKLTLGANASAAAGPVGRYASAATDASAKAEIYTTQRLAAVFAGVALDGPACKSIFQPRRGITKRIVGAAWSRVGNQFD